MKRRSGARLLPLAATAAVALTLYLLAGLRFHGDNWFSYAVLRNLVVDNGVPGIVAIGMTFVILTGGIDLSVGSLVALVGIVSATCLQEGWSPAATIALSLGIGAVTGAVMGWLVADFDLPPFMVTLGGMFLLRGCTLLINDGQLPITHPFYLGTADWLVNPAAMGLVLALICAVILLHYLPFGRNIYSVGGSEQSALLMGLPVKKTKILTYLTCSLLTAFAGVVSTLISGSGDSTQGVGMELDAIAAVVIGGTLLTGGRGFVVGTVLGTFILGLIQTAINFANINSWWTRIGIGLLLLVFVLLQRSLQRRSERR